MTFILKCLLYSAGPAVLGFMFYYCLKKEPVRSVIRRKYRSILLNTLIFTVFASGLIVIFLHFEHTIYYYDYSGYWIRSLEFKNMISDPVGLLKEVYLSMADADYTYLANLFLLPLMSFASSFRFFALAVLLTFIVPLTITLQLIVYSLFDDIRQGLMLALLILFFPLYFTLLNGTVDTGGVLFISFLVLIVMQKERTVSDQLVISVLVLLLIFFRRWYLFYVVSFYLYEVLRIALLDRKGIRIFLWSCIPVGLILILFFRPYLARLLMSRFTVAYSYYDRGNKLFSMIRYYGAVLFFPCLYSLYLMCKKKEYKLLLYVSVTTLVPYVLFTGIQTMEYHHYNLLNLNFFILILFFLHEVKPLRIPLALILVGQAFTVYMPGSIPLLTDVRRLPVERTDVEEVKALNRYLSSVTEEGWQTIYMASGDNVYNYEVIRNAVLPDISHFLPFHAYVLDLNQGFPHHLDDITYIILTDPVLYLDASYQHCYDVIDHAVKEHPSIRQLYTVIYEAEMSNGVHVQVYKKTGRYTQEDRQYLYEKMIHWYPDQKDYFSYILEK